MVIPAAHSKVEYLESAQLNGHALTFVFTYLGNIFNRNMSDDDRIMKQTTKLTVTGNTPMRRFSHCSRVKLDSMVFSKQLAVVTLLVGYSEPS